VQSSAVAAFGIERHHRFNILFPDPVIAELKSLDDQSFRDNLVIPNNSHVQTVVFVEKQAVTMALQEINVRATQAAAEAKSKLNTGQQYASAESAQALSDTLANVAKSSKATSKNSERSKWHKGKSNPLLVKLALGSIVIVGDEIAYLQRVQIQNSATPSTTPTPLTAVPSSLSFADQNVTTTSDAQSVTLTNTGSSALNNLVVSLSGGSRSDYRIESNTCQSSLAPAANCAISVSFNPSNSSSASAKRTENLQVSYNPGSAPLLVGLTGNALVPSDAVLLSSTNLAFQTTKVGQPSSATLTISNLSKSGPLTTVSIAAPAGSNPGDFSVSPSACNNLVVGNACSISVTFKPTATGPRIATISVTYPINGVSQSQTVTLAGTGQ
jgi:hypothetical protein